MARRKQRKPQHLENEKDLALSLENGIASASDTEEDEHVCGRCRAEFPSLADFLQHKKLCASKRPVLVKPPRDSAASSSSEDNDEEPLPPTITAAATAAPHPLLWGGLNPLLMLAQHRTDSNVTLEELKNTSVAVAQHGRTGEGALQDFVAKFRQSQVESLQLLKSLEHIIVQNALAAAAAPPALVGTAALTPPQSAEPPAPSAPQNLAAFPQGGRTEEEVPENSLALLEKQAERYLQDSMARRSFLLNGIDDDKSKRGKSDDPTSRHRCQFCGKQLGSESALQIHLRSHTGEKPFSCSVCGSCFSTRGNLKVHFQRHKDNDELMMTPVAAAEGQRKQQEARGSGERKPDGSAQGFTADPNRRDSSKMDAALDFSSSVNGRKSPNDENSRSMSPNDASNFSDNSEGSSDDDNMTAENFSELKIDVERYEDDGRDDSNMDDDESEAANSQGEYGTSPSFAPYFLPSAYEQFAPSANHPPTNNGKSGSNGNQNTEGSESILQDPTYYQDLLPRIGSNDNSWESLIEITKTSETSKLQQLVDNIEHKLIEPNQCIICHRVLSCKSALQMHYRTHTGERPFKCKLCSRAFTTKGNLKTHMGVHRTKPAPRLMHQCPVCHKPFPNTLLLQQHIRSHTENPSLQLTPLYAGVDDRPPTLLPPSYPRQFLLPPQLVSAEPLALTSNRPPGAGSDGKGESVIKTTGSEGNPCGSPAPSSGSSRSPPCNLDENANKDPQPPVLDLAQAEREAQADEKPASDDLPKLTEDDGGSPERRASSSSPAGADFEMRVKREPPNLLASPKPGDPQGGEARNQPEPQRKSPSKYELSGDRPLPMTLPSDCPIPFGLSSGDRPYPPMSVPDFTTASLTALENHVKGIASNVSHPLPFAPHFGLGLNVPGFYRDYGYPPKQPNPSPKNGSDGSADDRSTPGSGNPAAKGESPRSSMVVAMPKQENSNGAGALDLTPRSSPGFQRPVGADMKIFAPLAGLPFGPPHHRLGTTCRICYKTFACQSALEIHYRSHTKERPFRCEVCDRGFSTKGNMRQHMLTHKIRDLPSQVFSTNNSSSNSSPPKPEDEKSPKKAPEESAKRPPADGSLPLPQAKRAPGQPKHMCGVCQKPFSSGSALQIHMRTHTGDKPFQCHICHRAFTTKGNLKVHMGTHMWNNSTSRRGRRMSLDISPLQLPPGAKPGDFAQAPYFPYLSPFMNGLPPPQPPPKMNEISVIQTAGVSNGSLVSAAPPPTTTSAAPQPLALLGSGKRAGEDRPPGPPEIAVSWPWKISCKVCSKICSSSTELEIHVRNHHHGKRESPEVAARTESVA